MLIDSHCHLSFNAFDEDRAQVVTRAKEAGLVAFINPGTNLTDSQQVLALAEKIPELYAAVGVHPNDAAGFDEAVLAQLRELAAHPKVVAIGEIGLDYYRDHSPREVQCQVFREFMGIAKESGKPIIVHTRSAWDDVMKILREESDTKMQGVFHCFSGDSARAQELVAMGFHISFTGVITFKNTRAGEALEAVPLERLLLETDCPFMAPVPHRGKRNEPAYVRLVLERVAEILGRPADELDRITEANTRTIFNLPEPV